MKPALLTRFTRLWRRLPSPKRSRLREARSGGRRKVAQAGRRRPGFGLSTGIALAVLAMAARPSAAADGSPARNAARSVASGVATAGAAVPIDVAADKSLPASQFLTAYNSMALADWLKEKGMLAEAADLYTEALDLFNKLAADDPQWQPAVVSFRITYCRAALQNLQKSDGGPTPDRRKMEDREQTPEDGRRTTNDGLMRNAEFKTKNEVYPSSAAPEATRALAKGGRQTAEQRMPDDQKPGSAGALRLGESKIENRKSEISNLPPLNLKLQQAALRERGRDYTGALAIYIALLEEFPLESWALKGAGRCCLRLGLMDRARALTRQALTLSAPDADMYLLAALVDCYDGRYPAAVILLRQSLKLNGVNSEAHAALGVALAATGQLQEAQEEMKRALSLNPKLGDAYYNLARLSLRQKPTDRDTARVHYQNALRHGAMPDPELDALLAE